MLATPTISNHGKQRQSKQDDTDNGDGQRNAPESRLQHLPPLTSEAALTHEAPLGRAIHKGPRLARIGFYDQRHVPALTDRA